MDTPAVNHAWLWFAAGLIFAVAEIFLPSFFMLFAAIATLAPIGCALLGLGLTPQLIAFGLALLTTMFGLRPVFLKKLNTTKAVPSRTDRLLGLTGTVTLAINPQAGPGRITVMGEDWAASSQETIAVDQTAIVVGVDGVVLTVKALK